MAVLVGREHEQERLRRKIRLAGSGRGDAVVIRGEAGIGKTALLDWTADRAKDMRVLRTVGIESESELPFAALHALVHSVIGLVAELPTPQRRALDSAFARGSPEGVGRFAVCAATLGLLAKAAEEKPLLCIVDDAQWLDESSADALCFSARRVGADPVLILFAARDPTPSTFLAAGIRELHLEGLAEPSARALLAAAAPSLSSSAVDRLLGAAQGNPLALMEYVSVAEADLLDLPLPVTEGVQRSFRGRALRLSSPARRALLIAAAGDPAQPDAIWRALELDGLPPDALAEAQEAGLLRWDKLDFIHPLARSALYRSSPPADVRGAHRVLALATEEPARRAWHLASATTLPDETVARELELAAAEARARGGVSAEARALERAARLTPEQNTRARRLLGAGLAEAAAGHYERAQTLLAEAAELTTEASVRADAIAQQSYLLFDLGEFDRARDLALAAAGDEQRDLGARILVRSGVVHALVHVLAIDDARATAERAAALAPDLSDLDLCHMLAWTWELSGRTSEALDLIDTSIGRVDPGSVVAIDLANHFVYLESYDQASRLLGRIVDHVRKVGALGNLAYALDNLANLRFRTGRLRDARQCAVEAAQAMEDVGNDVGVAASLARLALIETTLGSTRDARAHGVRALEITLERGDRWNEVRARAALGLDALVRGDVEASISWLEPAVLMLDAGGVHHPNMFRVHGDLVEAKIKAGRATDAAEHVTRMRDDAALTGSRWAHAVTARCEAMLASPSEADAAYGRALESVDDTAGELERARTQLAYGECLRRARRRQDARELLREAVATFDRLGAHPWSDCGRAELRATGERLRPRRTSPHEHLTPQELQVALAVRDGLKNKEIAARLFLSPKTVESHLGRVYRKLGVRSRVELVHALADRFDGPQVAPSTAAAPGPAKLVRGDRAHEETPASGGFLRRRRSG